MADTEIGASVGEYAARAGKGAIEVVDPGAACLALEMLSFDAPYSEIEERTGIRPSLISKLKARHLGAIESRRRQAADEFEHLADGYREVLRKKVDGLLRDDEALKKASAKDLAIATGIMNDHAMKARGEATSVVEHRSRASLEDVRAAIEAAQKRVRGEAIDV